MKSIQEPPIGIIITHPISFFKEYSYERYINEHKRMNEEEGVVWYRVMKNLPTQDFLYVYTVIDGFMHHRTNLVNMIRNQTMTFPRPEGGRRTFENANAIVLGPPYVECPIRIPMKGFQGFRYVYNEIF
jgi:hypothetical protein